MAADVDRLEGIGAVLQQQRASIVALTEVSLSPAVFTEQARRWGYSHSLILRTDRKHRFNMGLLSTTPLKREIVATDAPFFHGALCARLPALADLLVCVVHLTPHSPSVRLQETNELLRLLGGGGGSSRVAAAPAGRVVTERLLLLGDLNALSARDASAHRADGLAQVRTGAVTCGNVR